MDSNEKIMNTLLEGLELYRKKEYMQAKMVWEALLAVVPHDFNVLHFMGMACFNLGQLDKAIAFMDKAIAINPNIPEIYNHRGSVLQELKHFEAAIASHNRALELKPDMVAAYTNRGNAFQQLKQFEAAVDSHDQALAFQPDFLPAQLNRKASLQAFQQAIYQRADKKVISYWDTELGSSHKPRVGLFWNPQGNLALSDWIIHLPTHLQYIFLQEHLSEADQATLNAYPELLFYPRSVHSAGDREALCELVDLIISNDMLTIHFSKILEKPLWLVLSPSDFDWKTGWTRYYERYHLPYHVKLYPVAQQEDWGHVLAGMASDLERCNQD